MSGTPGPNVIRVCKLCGEQYHPKSSRQQCCNKEILVPCVICGKPIHQICTTKKQPKTCSKECTITLGNIGRENNAHTLKRKCKFCGKEFTPNSIRDFYCDGPHYLTCEVCGKQFQITERYHAANKTCSDECRYKLAKQNTDIDLMREHLKTSLMEKYGVENPGQIPEVWDKIRRTNKERYGVDYYTQTQEYRDRVETTDLEKYGVKHHLSSPKIIKKRTETIQKQYGVDNVFQAKEIKEKIKETLQTEYGVENIAQSPEIHRRMSKNRNRNVAKDGKIFDSRNERKFYDFLLDIKETNVEMQVPLEYSYLSKQHKTLIDFKVNNIWFEVKGAHLIYGVYDRKGIPSNIKLQIYNDNSVVLITDNKDKVREILNKYPKIIGIDHTLFDNRMLTINKIEVWRKINIALQQSIKFIDADVINNIP